MSTAHQVDGNTLTLLRNGEEYFPRLIAAIDGATRFIHLETYIYAADSTGKSVSQALQRAAKRGLVVHLLLDGFGSGGLPDQWVMEMRASGVQVLWFRPEISLFRLRRYRLRRLHRKLAVIDGIIAFVSGMNINDDVPGGMITSPRLDYAIEVQGESVNHIHAVMRRLWVQVSWVNFRRQPKYDRHRDRLTDLPQPAKLDACVILAGNMRLL